MRTTRYQVGGAYRHKNGHWTRVITRVDGDTIYWRDEIGFGQCTRNTFAKLTEMAPVNAAELAQTREARADVRSEFQKLCEEAIRAKLTHVSIPNANVMGATFEEVTKNLQLLADSRLYLRIMS